MPATAKNARKISDNDQRTKEAYAAHFGWQAAVLKCSDLRPLFKLVAWVLALFRNVHNGRCDPAMGTIAERAVSISTVQRAINSLERLEFVAVVRRRGRHNCHQINFLSPPMADQKPNHSSDRFADENRSARYKKPVQNETDKHLEHAAPFGSGCEREAAPADAASPAVGRSPELPPSAGEESEPVKGSSEPHRSGGSSAKALPTGSARLEHIDTPLPQANGPTEQPRGQVDASGLIVERTADAIFQELSQFWSKSPWTDPATDRRAFDAALQRGVSPMRILEGGRSWAAAYSGPDGAPDAPHYLPGLAKWLAADKFLRKPPVRKRDVAAAFFKIGRIKIRRASMTTARATGRSLRRILAKAKKL